MVRYKSDSFKKLSKKAYSVETLDMKNVWLTLIMLIYIYMYYTSIFYPIKLQNFNC